MQDALAQSLVRTVENDPVLLRLATENLHKRIVPIFDLCSGLGGARFLRRRLRHWLQVRLGVDMQVEELVLALPTYALRYLPTCLPT